MDNLGQVFIVLSISDGSAAHHAYQTRGRGFRPGLDGWTLPDKEGRQYRLDTDQNIERQVRRVERDYFAGDGLSVLGWRRLTDAEHELFTANRPGVGSVYRNALVDNAGRIEHDLAKSKDCCRNQIRREREAVMPKLDADYMRALEVDDKTRMAEAVAAKQLWRDAPADPRIEAAQSIEELESVRLRNGVQAPARG